MREGDRACAGARVEAMSHPAGLPGSDTLTYNATRL